MLPIRDSLQIYDHTDMRLKNKNYSMIQKFDVWVYM